MYWGDHPGSWMWVPMVLSMVLFWGLLIAAIVLLVRPAQLRHRSGLVPGAAHAEQELATRFARGDIDEAEFLSRLANLREHMPT